MIKFDHAVKFNGKYYSAGAEIPEPVEVEAAEESVQEPAEPAQEPVEVESEATAEEQPEAPEKSTKRRKKGDA